MYVYFKLEFVNIKFDFEVIWVYIKVSMEVMVDGISFGVIVNVSIGFCDLIYYVIREEWKGRVWLREVFGIYC